MLETQTSPADAQREFLANYLVDYANKHGMWPTIDFIVKRWIEKNPEYFVMVKGAIHEAKMNLQNEAGTNDKTRKGNMMMRRVAEVPERIHILIEVLFPVEKKNYNGGEKQFWRDFSNRYPVFSIGKLL